MRFANGFNSNWDDVDVQTANIYLGHAEAAISAINVLRQATDA
jgi:hypothetical protein